jgi:hypothetical protein
MARLWRWVDAVSLAGRRHAAAHRADVRARAGAGLDREDRARPGAGRSPPGAGRSGGCSSRRGRSARWPGWRACTCSRWRPRRAPVRARRADGEDRPVRHARPAPRRLRPHPAPAPRLLRPLSGGPPRHARHQRRRERLGDVLRRHRRAGDGRAEDGRLRRGAVPGRAAAGGLVAFLVVPLLAASRDRVPGPDPRGLPRRCGSASRASTR